MSCTQRLVVFTLSSEHQLDEYLDGYCYLYIRTIYMHGKCMCLFVLAYAGSPSCPNYYCSRWYFVPAAFVVITRGPKTCQQLRYLNGLQQCRAIEHIAHLTLDPVLQIILRVDENSS